MTAARQRFVLRKWYLDCVDDAGDAAIVYCAELSWRAVRLSYSNLVLVQAGVGTSRTSMSRFVVPSIEQNPFSLALPKIGVAGTWEAVVAPVQRTVFASGEGEVHWECFQPKSVARLTIAGAGELKGLGYAECLTLTIPPWDLPLGQLRWGRFLSPQDSVVWVDWQGPFSDRFAYRNGQLTSPSAISESGVVSDDYALRLDCGMNLRSGRLGDTVAPSAPLLGKILPSALLGIQEHKWRSRGVLTSVNASSTGWAIHEVVHWKT